MKTNNFPGLDESFKRLKFLLDLDERTSTQHIMGLSIKLAIQEKKPFGEIVKFLRDVQLANPELLIEVIGEKLFNDLCEFV